VPDEQSLPDGVETADMDHHFAARVPAMWNASGALAGGGGPTMVLGDVFGKGEPDSQAFNVSATATDYASGTDSSLHGYKVLSLVANKPESGMAGVLPYEVPLRAVDVKWGLSNFGVSYEAAWIARYDLADQNVVFNFSLGLDCGGEVSDKWLGIGSSVTTYSVCTETYASAAGAVWAELVRGTTGAFSFEDRAVIASSAGNRKPWFPTIAEDGRWRSMYNAAALTDPVTLDGTTVNVLEGGLVAENARATSESPYEPDCLFVESWYNGNISAIGTDVLVPIENANNPLGMTDNGTSYSSPEVAAVAAAVWRLRPDLDAAGVRELMLRTTRDWTATASDTGCRDDAHAPLLDAYAALLATDRGVQDAPVRLAVLDVAGSTAEIDTSNGIFDDKDLAAYKTAFASYEARREADGNVVDFSRYDLNGDGYTGGETTSRFDLDLDGVWETAVTLDIDGTDVPFDETAVTDLQVLCHAAWTDGVFGGGPLSRTEELGSLCAAEPTGASVLDRDCYLYAAGDYKVCPNGSWDWDETLTSGGESASQESSVVFIADSLSQVTYRGAASGADAESELGVEFTVEDAVDYAMTGTCSSDIVRSWVEVWDVTDGWPGTNVWAVENYECPNLSASGTLPPGAYWYWIDVREGGTLEATITFTPS
jgi:hypothetical protein